MSDLLGVVRLGSCRFGGMDAIRQDVLEGLQQVDIEDLLVVCAAVNVQVADTKKTNKKAVENALIRYLTSEQVEDELDGGLAIFQKVDTELKAMIEGKDGAEGKGKVKSESLASTSHGEPAKSKKGKDLLPGATSETVTTTKIEFHKLREFVIRNGTVAGTGENCLDYMSLCYQIAEGKAHGYEPREVRNGVIRAMKAGSSLRKYFERNPDISESDFTQMLRKYYGMKDSSAVMSDMEKCVQGSGELEKDFAVRLFGMRDDIVALSQEEEFPKDKREVQRRMCHILA